MRLICWITLGPLRLSSMPCSARLPLVCVYSGRVRRACGGDTTRDRGRERGGLFALAGKPFVRGVHTAERGHSSAPRKLCSHSAAGSGWIQSPCHAGNHAQDDSNWALLSPPIDKTDLIRMGDSIADGSPLLYQSDSQRALSHVGGTCFTTEAGGTSVFSGLQAAKSGAHVYTKHTHPHGRWHPRAHTRKRHERTHQYRTQRQAGRRPETSRQTQRHAHTNTHANRRRSNAIIPTRDDFGAGAPRSHELQNAPLSKQESE